MSSISKKQFIDFMPKAVKLITNSFKNERSQFKFMAGILNDQIEPAVSHIQEALEYNLPGGKHARYMTLTLTLTLTLIFGT